MKRRTKQLLIEVPEKLHHTIKSWALFHNMTMKQYILQAVSKQMAEHARINHNRER